jgi:site-specific DNA-methyltransferase (adenine-specific)
VKPTTARSRNASTRTVGRGKTVTLDEAPESDRWSNGDVHVFHGDSLARYDAWPTPAVIVSDGAYGVLGFEGDTTDHLRLPEWYEPHVSAWSRRAAPHTTLWFWNSEIGWAAVHPVLERHGWRYVNANIWNKGVSHIAGNVNTARIRRFPVVSEVCVQYVREARIGDRPLKRWLLEEWRRTGLPLRAANAACGVVDAAVRKYLDQSHLWYFPPPAMFERLARHANAHGDPAGKPYFSRDGVSPMTADEWSRMRATFNCPHGVTNVWARGPLHGPERVLAPNGRAVHLNQKPLDLMARVVTASSEAGDVVWEPFGGLFTACLAALESGRRAWGCELDPTYFQYGVGRLRAARAP